MRPMPFYVLAGGLDLLEIAFMLELPTYVGEGSQEPGTKAQGWNANTIVAVLRIPVSWPLCCSSTLYGSLICLFLWINSFLSLVGQPYHLLFVRCCGNSIRNLGLHG
jgi:hypothetical protein